ncbi:ATP-dependent RNA helicase DDX51 [Pseudoliparis swirei]|uniref:ATP-dependent RNA helicase DDX51 n=1 Tax=Pseudoliparis swirei TaxID=2059687 RepID=UPI0024BEDD10|nr:ATP-dependent RNA helicase DDX51 [Pseudoliparis swirei]
MSLFLVNRYLGEEESESVPKEARSQVLLAKLQQKAKEKLKQRRTEPKERRDVKKKRRADENGGEEPRRHKKRKSEDAPSLDSDSVEPDEEDKKNKTGASEKQKKKKKKVQSGPPDTPVTGSEGQEVPEGGEGKEKEEEGETETENATLKPTTGKTSAPTGFTVLGGFENKPVQKVHRVLPQWLAQPDVIHRDIKSNLFPVSDIPGLSALLVKKLQNNGIQHLFPVQAEVIPAILESAQQGLLIGRGGYKPRDICVSAPTGSGKTLAFVIPVIQVLTERVVCEVRALAVLPTKELAQQVCKVFMSYAEGGTSLSVVMLAGQKSFAEEQASLSELRGGTRRSLADIVVATPGRLVDHINKNSFRSLDHLRFLIIDEADRMIDSMHQSWLSQVVKAVYRSGSDADAMSIFRRIEPAYITAASLSPPQMPLQKLLFSATLTQNPEKLQQLGLHQPRLFSSIHSHSGTTTQTQAGFDFPQGLTEYYVPCTLSKKPLLILHFILRLKLSPILCFTNSRETAHRLFLLVQLFGGVRAAEFSSRLSPAERKTTLKEFEQGKIQLMISTDAAARGIDVAGIKCVVNYDAPQYIRTYIHRIGRTARAGKTGLAFTFLLGVQEKNFLQMVTEAGTPGIQKQIVKPQNLKGMEARYEHALQELADAVKEEKH